MELTKTLVCLALVFVIATDVVFCRPASHGRHTDLETLVRDIDDRIIKTEKKQSRRRRRHLQTQQIALMEHCLRFRHRCRHEMERLRRLREDHREFRVVVIEK